MKAHAVIKSTGVGMIYVLILFLTLFLIHEGCRLVLVVEDEDTASISFEGGSWDADQRFEYIASKIGEVKVYYKEKSDRGFDSGVSLRLIEKLPRIASFNDTKQIVDIMNLLRYDEEEKIPEGIKRSGLRVYYIVFYYKEEKHVMIFPVKVDENWRGFISPWCGSIYSNKVVYKWLRELTPEKK